MRTCPECRKPYAPTARQQRYCGPVCKEAARKRINREAARASYVRRRADAALRKSTPTHQLGPALPLDGVTEAKRMRQREARLLKAIADGVDTASLVERFGRSVDRVRIGRVADSSNRLPLGTP